MVASEVAPAPAAGSDEPLALLRGAVAALAAQGCDGFGVGRLRGDLEELRRQIDLLEGEFLRRVGVVDRMREFFADEPTSLVGWLKSSCRLSGGAAVERVEVSRRLSELPLTGGALARGEIGYEHARVIARAASDMGPELARAAEPALLASAQEVDPGRLRDVAQEVRQRIDPEGALAAACRLHERRRLRLMKKLDGSFQVEGLLDAEGGATVATSLNALMAPVPGDTRTADQRRADAIVELCRRALQSGRLGHGAGQRPHLVLTVPAATLRAGGSGAGEAGVAGGAGGAGVAGDPGAPGDHGDAGAPSLAADLGEPGEAADRGASTDATGPDAEAAAGPADLRWAGVVPPETARRIACDAAVRRVVVDAGGTPLDVGRATRNISPALRRALELRDRGCRFPGCDRPPDWTSAHHLWHWARGGPTRLDNLVLLCSRCHTLVHEQGWRLAWGAGGELLASPP